MSGQRFRQIITVLATAMFLVACTLPLFGKPTQVAQSLSPELLGTPIAQTAEAAKTQTVVYMPPSLTPSVTRFPTGTPIPLYSPTTFIFALPTFTPLPTWTPTPGPVIQIPAGGTGSSRIDIDSPFTLKEWTCGIREKAPPMGAVIKQGVSYVFTVTLFNSGTKTWTKNGVDFRYNSGFRNDGKPIQDLPKTIAPGNEITLNISLTAPKSPGTYNMIWTLKVGRTSFCGVKFSFEVK